MCGILKSVQCRCSSVIACDIMFCPAAEINTINVSAPLSPGNQNNILAKLLWVAWSNILKGSSSVGEGVQNLFQQKTYKMELCLICNMGEKFRLRQDNTQCTVRGLVLSVYHRECLSSSWMCSTSVVAIWPQFFLVMWKSLWYTSAAVGIQPSQTFLQMRVHFGMKPDD